MASAGGGGDSGMKLEDEWESRNTCRFGRHVEFVCCKRVCCVTRWSCGSTASIPKFVLLLLVSKYDGRERG